MTPRTNAPHIGIRQFVWDLCQGKNTKTLGAHLRRRPLIAAALGVAFHAKTTIGNRQK